MTTWRIVVLVYFAAGIVFIAAHARRWWLELEQHARKFMVDNKSWPRTFTIAMVVMITLLSLTFDLAFWPRCAWIALQQRRAP